MQLILSRLQPYVTPSRQRQAALMLAWLLALLAIWWLASITWRWLTPPVQFVDEPMHITQEASNPLRSRAGGESSSDQTQVLQQLKLFGDRNRAAEAQAQQALEAPETTLNVRLVGLVASTNPGRSAAIIEQGGTQRTYIVDERIGNSRATLEAVYPDRVILNNGGRREALYIEGRDGAEAQLTIPTRQPATPVPAAERSEAGRTEVNLGDNAAAMEALSAVREDPSQLLQVMNVSPVRQGQQITGYRLEPRGDRELFAALGLESGDIAIAINGFDLTEPSEALAAMNELQEATRAIVQVQRGSQIIDLELQVP